MPTGIFGKQAGATGSVCDRTKVPSAMTLTGTGEAIVVGPTLIRELTLRRSRARSKAYVNVNVNDYLSTRDHIEAVSLISGREYHLSGMVVLLRAIPCDGGIETCM